MKIPSDANTVSVTLLWANCKEVQGSLMSDDGIYSWFAWIFIQELIRWWNFITKHTVKGITDEMQLKGIQESWSWRRQQQLYFLFSLKLSLSVHFILSFSFHKNLHSLYLSLRRRRIRLWTIIIFPSRSFKAFFVRQEKKCVLHRSPRAGQKMLHERNSNFGLQEDETEAWQRSWPGSWCMRIQGERKEKDAAGKK